MRRSKSSSNIPLPRSKRALSSENLRDTQPELKRTNSSSNLIPPRSTLSSRFSSKTKERNSTTRSLLDMPVSSRRNTATPLRTPVGYQRSRSRSRSPHFGLASPGQMLTTQKINDKKFVSDQYRKICDFLETKSDNFDVKSLKPLSLKVFVEVITLLFNEIDPKINITMENYKEIVLKYVKLYKYPGIISISLLKSVNTNHSWTSVMAIFGWLVDLIRALNGDANDTDNLRRYLALRMKAKFEKIDVKGKYVGLIDEIMGFDEDKYNILKDDCDKLRCERDEKLKIRAELQEKVQFSQNQFEKMKLDIKEFKEGNLKLKIEEEMKDNESELKLKQKNIEIFELELKKVLEKISKQKYTIEVQQSFERELEEKQFSLKLKEEEYENIQSLKEKYDLDETNRRRQIESEIHKINANLLKLKLNQLDEDAKKIQLPDRGFHSTKFLDLVEEKRHLLVFYKEKIESQYVSAEAAISEIEKESVSATETLESLNKMERNLESEMEHWKQEIERVQFEYDILKKKIEKDISDLKKNAPDIQLLMKQNEEKEKELNDLDEEIDRYSRKSMKFFVDIHESMATNTAAIRSSMAVILEESFEKINNLITQNEAVRDVISKYLDSIHK